MAQRGRRPSETAEPAPRFPDGHLRLGPTPGEAGLWVPIDARLSVSDDGSARGPRAGPNAPRYPNLLYSEVPFKPWARAVLDYRLQNPFEPHARCKPSGGARQPLTPYGIELFEIRELQRAYLMDLGGPHTYRIIYMDGREHPAGLTPSYYGHSIGWWEDETFVVDTIGFNERFWIDREGMPHTEQLHTIERYERIDAESMLYTITVDDPGAYTEEWTGGFYMRWSVWRRTLRVRLPGQQLRQRVDDRERGIGRSHQLDHSIKPGILRNGRSRAPAAATEVTGRGSRDLPRTRGLRVRNRYPGHRRESSRGTRAMTSRPIPFRPVWPVPNGHSCPSCRTVRGGVRAKTEFHRR